MNEVSKPKIANYIPAFSVGDESAKRLNGKIVGVIVSVNVSHKNREREGDAAIPIYEVPLMRRLYEREGGTLVIRPNWVPSIPRHRVLTDALFDDGNPDEYEAIGELPRLRRTYLLKNHQTKIDLMAEVYGATKAEQAKNLQNGMKDIWKAWTDLFAKKKLEVMANRPDLEDQVLSLFPADTEVTRRIFDATLEAYMLELTGFELTVNELEALVNLVDPRAKGIEEYDLPGLDLVQPQRARLALDDGDEVIRPRSATVAVIGKDAQLDAPYGDAMAEALGSPAGHSGQPEAESTEVNPPADELTVSEKIQEALEQKGYSQTTAMEIATLALDHADLPDSVLDHVIELKKHKGKYGAVRRVVAGFLAKV